MNLHRKNFLKKLQTLHLKNNIPSISEENAKIIHFLIQNKQAKNVLEIGTCQAYSTIWIADSIEAIGGTVLSLEISIPSYEKAVANVAIAQSPNIEIKNIDALEYIPNIKQTFDVIFIDAQKKYYLDFLKLSLPLLNKNGLIIIDDVLKFKEKTANLNDYVMTSKSVNHVIIPTDADDGIMLISKASDEESQQSEEIV